MSSLLLRRNRRILGVSSAVSLLAFLACGGSASQQGGANGGTSSDEDSGVSTHPSTPSGSSSGSTEDAASGSSSGSTVTGDSGPIVVTPVDGSACPASGSQVVMIGDSYFALSESSTAPAGEITQELQTLATASGALASGDSYRHYYESGANMATTYSSLVTPIPTQFANAVTANPDIKYVIMDGGGNDILLENTACIQAEPDAGISSACETSIQNAINAATTLFQAMKTAGVEKIIYFFYPNLPTTTFPSVNVVLDYAFPLVQAACQASPVPCYFVDTRPAFAGNDATYIKSDNIHPTTAGSDAIAKLLWSEMTNECVALSP